jgi:tetratricopeptide (TPR) repeat protein
MCRIRESVVVVLMLCVGFAQACLPRPPKRPQAELVHLRQGARQLQQGDLDRAEAHFAVAAAYNRRSGEALNGLGLVALARGERRRARRHFTRALALNEDLSEAQNNLGVLELACGKWRAAVARFQAALDVDPGFHQARFNRARALFQGGQHKKARQDLLLVTAARPQLAKAWSALAMVSVALRRKAAAGRALRQARARAPGAVHVLVAEGMLRRVSGNLQGALAAHGAACRKAPGNLTARLQYALTLIRARRHGAARAALRRVLAGRPFAARVYFALGYLAALRADLRAALKAYRRTTQLEPHFLAAWLHLAAAQLGLGHRRASRLTCTRLTRRVNRSGRAGRAGRRMVQSCRRLLAHR